MRRFFFDASLKCGAGIEFARLDDSLISAHERFGMSALPALGSALPAADDRLAELVCMAIRERGIRALAGMAIFAHQATVTLRGPARSFYERQLMLHAVQRVPGVLRIVDELHVLSSQAGG